ncbi:ABC transporter substrate-binding protein [Halobacteriales archaeon Cl-PHB]
MPRDGNAKSPTRRRFLQATGSVALASAVAGCPGDGGDGDGDGTGDGNGTGDGDGGTPSDGGSSFSPPTSYPYSPGETDVESAKQVMEEAGYGPDNRYDLSWIQYTSPAWKEMANTIRARLSSAYIDMSISEASFSELLKTTEKGNHEAYTLGWIADYPQPQNFVQLFDPENTVYDAEGAQPNGARLFWSEDAKVDSAITEFQSTQFDKVVNNPDATDEAREKRNTAALKMEEGNWAAAGLVPIYHRKDEFFWYDDVDYTPPGGMGSSRAKDSTSVSSLSGSSTLQGTSGTFNSLDPIASGNTASGAKVMNMFDAPLNYANGTTEVENLLVEDWSRSDDLTTYEFTLKQGIQFHGDYGEVTADDIVYSLRRLVESPNSTNTYFPMKVLGIKHETKTETYTDDEGKEQEREVVVPDSTAVTKTGDYSFKIELKEAFAYALPVLAYAAFSAVPEGIVGDIEGYDGEMSWQEFSTNPVGCGPFEFDTWESGDGGEFAATSFDGYHGEGANFDGVHDAIIVDPNASYNYFLNENAHVSGIPTSKYDPNKVSVESEEGLTQLGSYGPLENDKTVNYAGVPTINTFYVGFNMEKVPAAVRKAMAYVVNQDQFIQNVFKGRGQAAYHLQPAQVIKGGGENYKSHYQG